MTPIENITAKIGKLLKLAEKTPFPEEAASAVAKAQALMTEHAISEAMIDAAGTEKQEPEEKIQNFSNSPLNEGNNRTRLPRWKLSLGSLLTKANGCFMLLYGNRMVLIGKPSRVDTVRYLYEYCVRQIDMLTKEHCKGQGRIYANNFRIGCVDAISEAIEKEKEALIEKMRANRVDDSKALVVLNNAIAKVNSERSAAEAFARSTIKFGQGRSSSSGGQYNHNARSHGRSAGASIYPGGSPRAGIGSGQRRIN